MVNDLLSFCGAVSIVGGAILMLYKFIAPVAGIGKRVKALEFKYSEEDERIKVIESMQKQQSKCLAAMLNHTITGNGIENMKKIRDELLESIIEA